MAVSLHEAPRGDGASDHGNIVQLEHVNLNTDDPEAAVAFFCQGLGCVQDPRQGELVGDTMYLNKTMWANAGLNQFHVPFTNRGASGPLNNIPRGRVGLDVPSLVALRGRLAALARQEPFRDGRTRLAVREAAGGLEVTGPSGVEFFAREQGEAARDVRGRHPGGVSWCLGVPFVELRCPVGAAPGIARYYRHYFHAQCEEAAGVARVRCGPAQHLIFVEDAGFEGGAGAAYQEQVYGWHICLYVTDHLGPMQRLAGDGLLWGNPRFYNLDHSLGLSQFRCKDIVDPSDEARPRRVLLELEHEVRILEHSTSPFRTGLAPKTYPTVPALVRTVTDEYEIDFAARRAKGQAGKRGFVPTPPTSSQLQGEALHSKL